MTGALLRWLAGLDEPLAVIAEQPLPARYGRAIVPALGRTGDGDRSLDVLDLHPRRDQLRELAERAVDHHAPRRKRDVDASGQFDWLSTDSTHSLPDEAHDFAADSFLLRGA